MTNTDMFRARWSAVMMDNYGVPPVALVRGHGAQVWDVDDNEYLDLVAGIAVNTLGHAHPAVIAAVTDQIARLGHTSNLAIHDPGLELAERLLALCQRLRVGIHPANLVQARARVGDQAM